MLRNHLVNLSLAIAGTIFSCQALCFKPVLAADKINDSEQQNNITYSADNKTSNEDKKEIEKVLSGLEKDWNSHNLESVMAYYSDDYVNNDGFDKKTINLLTKDLWETYPDIKSESLTKEIRIEGPFATVVSRDTANGTTAKEVPGLGTKGELRSVSEGQLYVKRVGTNWKIIGDRIDFEKIKVSYGLARQLDPSFAAPEQVKAGKQFSAKLEVDIPSGLNAMGTITQALVTYPAPKPPEVWKFMGDPANDHPLLERVMVANSKNRNELLMATIGLTNSSRNALMGVAILTRRLNVVPVVVEEETQTKAEAESTSTDSTKSDSQTKSH